MRAESERATRADRLQGSRLRRSGQPDGGTDDNQDNCLHAASHLDGSGPGGSALARLQGADIFDDLVDLRVTEALAECRHRTLLADLDTVVQKFVVSLRIHQLRSPASSSAAVGVAKAAGACEQLLDVQ